MQLLLVPVTMVQFTFVELQVAESEPPHVLPVWIAVAAPLVHSPKVGTVPFTVLRSWLNVNVPEKVSPLESLQLLSVTERCTGSATAVPPPGQLQFVCCSLMQLWTEESESNVPNSV